MSLVTLPEEVLLIILRQLDVTSLCNLYHTGNQRIQDVICTQGAIKECNLSLSTMATAKTLKLNFFKSISKNLLELNLSAIQDLSRSLLLPAMNNLTRLVNLNVAYTKITIMDLLDVYKLCPSIKIITINFRFFKPSKKINFLQKQTLAKYQDLFTNFEDVHFVGSKELLLLGDLPLYILQEAKLNNLTFTIAENMTLELTQFIDIGYKPPMYNKLNVNILYWKGLWSQYSMETPPIIKALPSMYEYIFIHECHIDISPIFEDYFKENFRYNSIHIKPCINKHLWHHANYYIMVWNKETTCFDQSFFQKFDKQIKALEPCIVTYSDGMAPVILRNDWICTIHPLLDKQANKKDEFSFKRRRVANPAVKLDYDELLQEKQEVQLTICFYDHIHQPVTLSANSNFLHKLTFLQLRGEVRYSREFFNIIFRCCSNLVTFDVDVHLVSPCTPSIARSIPLSRSIKNIRIVDKTIDLNSLFSSLSQCAALENIIVIDSSSSKVSSNIPSADTLIRQCDNLYYISISSSISITAKIKKLKVLNKIKEKYRRHHLSIEVEGEIRMPHGSYHYDPFVNVYKLAVKENYVV